MDEKIIQVIKWVLIVLVAGFIGYFGRHLAEIIIKKFQKEKSEPKNIVMNTSSEKEDKYRYKLEKKRLKLQKKKLKEKEKKD